MPFKGGRDAKDIQLQDLTEKNHASLDNVAASQHHEEPSGGKGITDEGTNQFGLNVIKSGTITLSSGVATLDTGKTDTSLSFLVALGVQDPDNDCKVNYNLFWDDSAGTHKVEINEATSLGNPTINYEIIQIG